MIEHAVLPLRRIVTGGTVGGKACQRVARVGGLVEIRDVTGRAIAGSSRELPAGMALHARHLGMRARQNEASARVIERCAGPCGGVMAEPAILRKAELQVVGIRRLLKILQMATVAIGRRIGELAVDVALRTAHGGMRAGQRKRSAVVIELCSLPVRSAVASVAGGRKTALRMVRIVGVPIIRHVAA